MLQVDVLSEQLRERHCDCEQWFEKSVYQLQTTSSYEKCEKDMLEI